MYFCVFRCRFSVVKSGLELNNILGVISYKVCPLNPDILVRFALVS